MAETCGGHLAHHRARGEIAALREKPLVRAVGPAVEVDPLVFGDPELSRRVGSHHDGGGGLVDVHDGVHVLRVGEVHHPVALPSRSRSRLPSGPSGTTRGGFRRRSSRTPRSTRQERPGFPRCSSPGQPAMHSHRGGRSRGDSGRGAASRAAWSPTAYRPPSRGLPRRPDPAASCRASRPGRCAWPRPPREPQRRSRPGRSGLPSG